MDTKKSRVRKKPKNNNAKRIAKFCYNAQDGTYCNRTPFHWCILFAYVIFFNLCIGLILLLTVYFVIENLKHTRHSPLLKKEQLFDEPVPGFTFVPAIATYHTPLIWYGSDGKTKGQSNVEDCISAISKFLLPYKQAEKQRSNYSNCTSGAKQNGKPCFFDIESLGPCAKVPYGYKNQNPCIIMKLNKFIGWMPQKYGKGDPNIPNDIAKAIESNPKDTIWVDCKGANDFSTDHVKKINYFPSHGFPFEFFPYENEPNYLPPIIAIELKSIEPGNVITVDCRLYAKNISPEAREEQKLRVVIYELKNK